MQPVPISDPAQAQRTLKSVKQNRLRMGSEHSPQPQAGAKFPYGSTRTNKRPGASAENSETRKTKSLAHGFGTFGLPVAWDESKFASANLASERSGDCSRRSDHVICSFANVRSAGRSFGNRFFSATLAGGCFLIPLPVRRVGDFCGRATLPPGPPPPLGLPPPCIKTPPGRKFLLSVFIINGNLKSG